MNQDDVRSMIDGYRRTCLIVAASRLCVFELVGGGKMHVESLADATSSKPSAMRRLLKALEVINLVKMDGNIVQLTALGSTLLGKDVRNHVNMVGSEYMPSWAELGRRSVDGRATRGDPWVRRKESVVSGRSFNELMRSSQAHALTQLEKSFAPSRFKTIVDVGGGYGQLLAGLLVAAPGSRGILFDLPHVLDEARGFLSGLHPDVYSRISVHAGSFFVVVPKGGDLYVLRNVLHDWGDQECVDLLKRCREAMEPGSLLLVMEDTSVNPIVDVHLMIMHGGASRSQEGLRGILGEAGFLVSRSPCPGAFECLPVRAP